MAIPQVNELRLGLRRHELLEGFRHSPPVASKPQSAVTNWQHALCECSGPAGMPDRHPHQLRDTFAVGLLEKGVPMEEVSKAVGHDSHQDDVEALCGLGQGTTG